MTPAAQGRHCAACNKVVIDFTQKTDAEILALLQHTSAPCGRFREDQLQRPLLVPPVPAPRWKVWVAAMATILGLREVSPTATYAKQSTLVGVQPNLPGIAPASEGQILAATTAPDSVATVVIRGRVMDAQSHDSLPGITVMVKNTTLGVSTKADGSFELVLPADFDRKTPLLLVCSFVGYIRQELAIYPEAPTLLTIALVPDFQQLSGELIVVGGISRKPWPWHPRTLWYQLTRPFRQ